MQQNLRPCCSRLVGLAVLYLTIIHILATSNAKPLITTDRWEPENESTDADISSEQTSPTIVIGSTDDLGSTPATNRRRIDQNRWEPESESTGADVSSEQTSPRIVIGTTDDLGSTPVTNQRIVDPANFSSWRRMQTILSGDQEVRCFEENLSQGAGIFAGVVDVVRITILTRGGKRRCTQPYTPVPENSPTLYINPGKPISLSSELLSMLSERKKLNLTMSSRMI